MIVLSSRQLKEMVAPEKLEDVLESLKQRGLIKYYIMSASTVCIKATKHAEISALLSEESKQRPNPRPYVQNKQLTKRKK